MSEHLTPEQHELLRKRLLRKGGQIAKKLADLLAGKDVQLVELADLRGRGGPNLRAEQKLRAYLDLINERRQALEAKDGTYGVCAICGAPLSWAELDQMPWATQCRDCAGKTFVAGAKA
ncbi:MAG: hypothetical protein AAFX99_11825 [Myxococcota bacterium]